MYYINRNVSLMQTNKMYLLFNFDNGVVAGIDKKAAIFYKKLLNSDVDIAELDDEETNFFEYLIDSEFIYKEMVTKNNSPVSAYLHLTNKCNLHCVGCYSLDDKRNACPDMSTMEIFDALSQLRDIGVENVVFSGGEPLLTKDILKIVKYAKEECKFPNLILITNGTIFNKKLLSELPKYIDVVSVSLDTYSSESEPFLRDAGIFDKIMRSISWLIETGNKVNILPTIHHLNANDLEKYVELSNKLGVSISFSLLSACYEGELLKYLPNKDDLISISNFMKGNDLSIDDSSISSELFHAENNCGAGQTIVSVGTDGNVYPCHMLLYDEFCIGNTKSTHIRDMLKNSPIIKDFKDINVDNLDGKCRLCKFRYFCGGGCRARAYMKTNRIKACDPYCSLFTDYYTDITKDIFE